MSVEYGVPKEIQNGFKTLGRKQPPHQAALSSTDASMLFMNNGIKDRVVFLANSRGAGLYMQTPNEHGVGDCKSDAPGKRGTKLAAAGTADNSKPNLVCLMGTDRSGMTIDTGGGRDSTVTVATGDGQSGMIFGKGFVAIWCEGTEVVIWGSKGGNRVTSTKQIVWEPSQGSGKRVTAVS